MKGREKDEVTRWWKTDNGETVSRGKENTNKNNANKLHLDHVPYSDRVVIVPTKQNTPCRNKYTHLYIHVHTCTHVVYIQYMGCLNSAA